MSTTAEPKYTEPAEALPEGVEMPHSKSWLGSLLPSFGVSFLVHALLLLVLACIMRSSFIEQRLFVSSELVEQRLPEEFSFDSSIVDMIGNESTDNTLSSSLAAATQIDRNPERKLNKQVKETVITVDQPPLPEVFEPNTSDVLATVDTFGSTEHPGGVQGAIDRLTYEIAGSLRQKKTLVIWLFDASLSLNARRNAIADRFANIYKQLGQMEVGGNGALKTAVASFGEQTYIMTPKPLENVEKIVEAIRNIEPDSSGKEFVFSAVAEVANKWKPYRTKQNHNVMMIIITDERGDDYAGKEEMIHRLDKYGMRIYCIGSGAVFGREKGYVSFVDAKGYNWSRLPVDQGPETYKRERLQLAYWGGGGEQLSSVFGPYALTRLCVETGGLYLIAEQAGNRSFDPDVMREYQPDYRPIATYNREQNKNQAKAALITAATISTAMKFPSYQRRFRADTDSALRRQITTAQQQKDGLIVFDGYLKEILTSLSKGEKHREKLTTPRWRASYDLAMGRALSMHTRAFGYNVVLADMKSTPRPFNDKGSNMWRLESSEESDTPGKIQKMGEKAKAYLNRVIEEHPGTPWEAVARRELSQPMGWKWQEGYMEIPKPQPPGSNNPNPNPAPPMKRKINRPNPGPQPKL